jgi:Replication-relaxation
MRKSRRPRDSSECPRLLSVVRDLPGEVLGRWSEQVPGQPAAVTDFFLEYDTGTEPLTRVAAKLAGYAALAARTGITTPVLFWLPSARREAALHARLAGPPPPGIPGAACAGQIPGVPVATAAPGASPQGPAGTAWLPAGSPGPRLRLATAWDSWSWQQSPAAWLAALAPMAAASLQAALAQAAGDHGVLAQRAATRQTARATVTSLQVRDLIPGSVTVTVTTAQVITSSNGTSHASASWAVTLTPAGSGWLVWDIEPAAAGNS